MKTKARSARKEVSTGGWGDYGVETFKQRPEGSKGAF